MKVTCSTLTAARSRLLRMHYESGVGHIGGNLSSLDALMVLFHEFLGPRDRFVLSKGHSAGALYVALWSVGRLTEADLGSFHRDATLLAGHPPAHGMADISFATGSLGHGLSLAAGTALAWRLQSRNDNVYCLTSDGEWQEGSTWEALIFAQHPAEQAHGAGRSQRPAGFRLYRRCGLDGAAVRAPAGVRRGSGDHRRP